MTTHRSAEPGAAATTREYVRRCEKSRDDINTLTAHIAKQHLAMAGIPRRRHRYRHRHGHPREDPREDVGEGVGVDVGVVECELIAVAYV